MTVDWKKALILNLPYLLFVYLFDKLCQAVRLAPGLDASEKFLHLSQGFTEAFSSGLPSLYPLDLLVGIAGAVVVRLVVYAKSKNTKKYRKGIEYGSARWGTAADIAPYVDPVPDWNIPLTQTEKLTMSSRPKNPKYARNKNILVIGGSGSGKTRFFVKPALMQMHSSYVVTDPKGQLLSEVGTMLRRGAPKLDENGKPIRDADGKVIYEPYRIKVLNTINFKKSMKYNPFAYIRSEEGYPQAGQCHHCQHQRRRGKILGRFLGEGRTAFVLRPDRVHLVRGGAGGKELPHAAGAYQRIGGQRGRRGISDRPWIFCSPSWRRTHPDHFAVRQYKKYKLASGKTAKSILISCGARLAPFDIPQLREIMSYDELELDKLGDEKSALFFLISDTDTTYNFLVALAFSQMFNLLCERADNTYGGRLPYHVRVLWDEAANTGQVPGLEKIVAVIRSREISLTLFYQAMSQCKALYKDHSETIMGNMDSIVFLGGREASTLKDISENWLGKATISMQTEGRSRGQSESYSQNMQRLGRELMTTSEITTMPGDKCILQLRGLPPFLSPKYDLKKHPNYKYTAEFDKKKNAFRLESLFRHRPLRLKPEDEYTVYEVDGSDTDEEADLLNFDDLDSDEFV